MTRIYVLVEGQTEETFIRDVIAPHYFSAQCYFEPILAKTSASQKGGIVNYHKTRHQLDKLCKQHKNALITTMIDYYQLPASFPGMEAAEIVNTRDIHQRIQKLQTALEQDMAHNNLIAYYQLHEYEALLFCEPDKFSTWLDNAPTEQLNTIKQQFDTPEHINTELAPSKRIEALAPHYNKVLHGPMIAEDIGLPALREQCPHFHHWLTRIEESIKKE